MSVGSGGQYLYGLGGGIENASEMGYRQAVTPDELQGRMNTTMRSVNRAMIVVGAPVGGLLADAIGYRPTLWIAIVGFAVVAVSSLHRRFCMPATETAGHAGQERSSGRPIPRSGQAEEHLARFDARDAHPLGPVRCQPGLPGEP